MAIASLVLGIIAFVFSWVPILNLFLLIPALLSFIFGLISICKNNSKAMSIIGLVLSVIATIIIIFWNLVLGGIIGKMGTNVYKEYMHTEKKYYSINEQINIGKTTYKITKVETSTGDENNKPKDGNKFVIIHVDIQNNGDHNTIYTPYLFKLENSKGQITEHKDLNIAATLSSGELAPGGSISGTVYFEQPIEEEYVTLITSFNTKVYIEL